MSTVNPYWPWSIAGLNIGERPWSKLFANQLHTSALPRQRRSIVYVLKWWFIFCSFCNNAWRDELNYTQRCWLNVYISSFQTKKRIIPILHFGPCKVLNLGKFHQFCYMKFDFFLWTFSNNTDPHKSAPIWSLWSWSE